MHRAASLLFSLLLATPVWAANTYGLVIGIDDYANVPKLDGAVNDARDIAEALTQMDAEVVVLLDGDATRAAILDNWREIASKMRPGDRMIVSYAGHGSYEPDLDSGEEEDGRDENFLLAGFNPVGPGAAERIRDDEIASLIDSVVAGEVIFIADSCHSGTVSRDIDPPLGYRYVKGGKIADDPLPPPPPNSSPNDGQEKLTLFLAAVDEANKVPEFMIDGKPRGALSYAFARALRGHADMNGDKRITQAEIGEFVRKSVRGISHGLQAPQVQHSGRGEETLFVMEGAEQPAPSKVSKSVFDSGFDELPQVPVYLAGMDMAGLEGATIISDRASATILYDLATGYFLTPVGDRAGYAGQPDEAGFVRRAQAIVDKYRVIGALTEATGPYAPEIYFSGGDGNYREGETLSVRVDNRGTEYVSIFNLASNGEMAFIYPINQPSLNIVDPATVAANDTLDLGLQVVGPFGADHIVVIESGVDPALLRRILASYSGSSEMRPFWNQLRRAASADPNTRIAGFAYHTLPE